jgi:hypothetical protein
MRTIEDLGMAGEGPMEKRANGCTDPGAPIGYGRKYAFIQGKWGAIVAF